MATDLFLATLVHRIAAPKLVYPNKRATLAMLATLVHWMVGLEIVLSKNALAMLTDD